MIIDQAHGKSLDIRANIEAPPISVLALSSLLPPYSTIDRTTIQADFAPALPSQYTLEDGDTTLIKIGAASASSRCFEVTGRPRPGKFFMRVKFNATIYSVITISVGLVSTTDQVAWTKGSLAGGAWHEIKIEHVSGNTYLYKVNDVVLYQGTASHMTFYGHSDVTRIEVDTGQRGSILPIGYEWF